MLTFEDWAKGCKYKCNYPPDLPTCYEHESEWERSCNEDDCPRLDEYTADVEADAYESHLLDKGDDARDREEV